MGGLFNADIFTIADIQREELISGSGSGPSSAWIYGSGDSGGVNSMSIPNLSKYSKRLASSGFVVWFTGLPCSGKTTLAEELGKRITGRYMRILDGDELRKGLCMDLGFSREDRDENVRRVALMAKELVDAGAVVLVALVSPYRTARDNAREIIGGDRFVEVHVDCGLEECIRRDTKGMYKKAIRRELPEFTGIDDPYETPIHSELHLWTDHEIVETSVEKVLIYLKGRGVLDWPIDK